MFLFQYKSRNITFHTRFFLPSPSLSLYYLAFIKISTKKILRPSHSQLCYEWRDECPLERGFAREGLCGQGLAGCDKRHLSIYNEFARTGRLIVPFLQSKLSPRSEGNIPATNSPTISVQLLAYTGYGFDLRRIKLHFWQGQKIFPFLSKAYRDEEAGLWCWVVTFI